MAESMAKFESQTMTKCGPQAGRGYGLKQCLNLSTKWPQIMAKFEHRSLEVMPNDMVWKSKIWRKIVRIVSKRNPGKCPRKFLAKWSEWGGPNMTSEWKRIWVCPRCSWRKGAKSVKANENESKTLENAYGFGQQTYWSDANTVFSSKSFENISWNERFIYIVCKEKQ